MQSSVLVKSSIASKPKQNVKFSKKEILLRFHHQVNHKFKTQYDFSKNLTPDFVMIVAKVQKKSNRTLARPLFPNEISILARIFTSTQRKKETQEIKRRKKRSMIKGFHR